MKKMIIAACCMLGIFTSQAKKVEFSVDMTGQVKSTLGIHIMGDFQNVAGFGADWTPNTCLMSQDATDTNIYHFVADLPAFNKYEYKFINGDQSYEVEVVPLESQVGYNFDDNRWIYVDSLNSDTTHLLNLQFSMNAPQGLNMIRFLVDMTSESVSANGVHVAGSFQGNDPTTDRMYSFQNNVYEHISYMVLADYAYKFYNGNASSATETVPSACATSGFRTINLTKDTILANVCFSKCTTCYPTAVTNQELTASVDIMPNPMTNQTQITVHNITGNYSIKLIDMTGNMVYSANDLHSTSTMINRNHLKSGVYQLLIHSTSGQFYSSKLLID